MSQIKMEVPYVEIGKEAKAFKDEYTEKLPRTEYVCNNVLSLPCYFTLPEQWQDYIINSIKEFYEKN